MAAGAPAGAGAYLLHTEHWAVGVDVGGDARQPRRATDDPVLRGWGDIKGTVRGGQPNPGARQIVADLRRGDITIELFQVAGAAPLPDSRKNPSAAFCPVVAQFLVPPIAAISLRRPARVIEQ